MLPPYAPRSQLPFRTFEDILKKSATRGGRPCIGEQISGQSGYRGEGDIMEYAIGDKVLYPNRGAGTIIGLEHEELVNGFEHYYVIEVESQRLTLRVPMRMMETLGVRRVMHPDDLPHVLDVLSSPAQSLPDDFKERQEQIRDRLRSGRPVDVAYAVRDLSWREQQTYLTKADSKLLAQGREILADEVALVLDKENVVAEQILDKALGVHLVEESVAE